MSEVTRGPQPPGIRKHLRGSILSILITTLPVQRITTLLQLFLVIIAIGLSVAVILIHSCTIFSTPSSILYISNRPALYSSCLAIASFLLHFVLAARTPPPEVTNQEPRFLPYKQYVMFGLVVVTTIPNALACVALFLRRRDLDHKRLVNVVESVRSVHGFLFEVCGHICAPIRLTQIISFPPYQTLGKNLEAYRMKHEWPRTIRLTRAIITSAVIPQGTLLISGAICLFVIDFDFEILWFLPCLMLWSQLALSIVMALFGETVRSAPTRPLKLSIVFYGITAVASSCLAAAGVALHLQLTFVQQYLFLQVALVWTSYRLMTVIHNILPTRVANDRDRGDVEIAAGAIMVSFPLRRW